MFKLGRIRKTQEDLLSVIPWLAWLAIRGTRPVLTFGKSPFATGKITKISARTARSKCAARMNILDLIACWSSQAQGKISLYPENFWSPANRRTLPNFYLWKVNFGNGQIHEKVSETCQMHQKAEHPRPPCWLVFPLISKIRSLLDCNWTWPSEYIWNSLS